MWRAANYLGFVIIMASILLAPSFGSAEIFKCKGADGRIRYADAPCVENESVVKIELPDMPSAASADRNNVDKESDVSTRVTGQIRGPDISLSIKDATATITHGKSRTIFEVKLYPFKLSSEELKVANDAVISRGNLKSSRIMLAFPGAFNGELSRDKIIDVVYDDYYGTYERTQDRNIVKKLFLNRVGEKDFVTLALNGAIEKYALKLNLKTRLFEKGNRSSKTVTRDELSKRNSAKGTTYEVSGRILHDSKPLPTLNGRTPRFSIDEAETRQRLQGYKWRYNEKTGQYNASGLPAGSYKLYVDYPQVDGEEVKRPGDYIGHKRIDIDSHLDIVDINMQGVIHILQPFNNTIPLPRSFEKGQHDSPITFEWMPISEGALYKYRISSTSHSTPESKINIYEHTRDTKVTHELPKGTYKFNITAFKADVWLGYLIVNGVHWSSTDYIFDIR